MEDEGPRVKGSNKHLTSVDWFDTKLQEGTTHGQLSQKSMGVGLTGTIRKKILQLSTNPEAFREFDTLADKFRQKRKKANKRRLGGNDFIAYNRENVDDAKPERKLARFAENRDHREERFDKVHDTHKKILDEFQTRVVEDFTRKEKRRAKLAKRLETLELLRSDEHQKIQKRWFVLLEACARVSVLEDKIIDFVEDRKRLAREKKAVDTIQNFYIRYQAKKRQQEYEMALQIVHKALRNYIQKRRARKLRRSATAVKRFMEDVAASGRFSQLVKRFMSTVKTTQKITRQYLVRRKARMMVLELCFRKADNKLATEEAQQVLAKKKKRKRQSSLQVQLPPLNLLPEDVMHQLCRRVFIKMCKDLMKGKRVQFFLPQIMALNFVNEERERVAIEVAVQKEHDAMKARESNSRGRSSRSRR
ncbi:hypothetical protein PCE1_004737 [Barthelona sp. PCE]